MNRGLPGVFKDVPAFGVPLVFLRAIRRLRLAVHAALPSLLRIGCRHPASREENEDLILDQRGIRSTHYVPGESWFGDECAHCLFREWRYSSHRIQSAGALLSLEAQRKKNTRVATRMRRGWRSSTKDRFHARTQAGVPVSLDEAFNRRSFHLTKRCQERFWVLMRTQSLDQPEWIRPPKPGTRWPSNTDSSASQAVQRSLSERTSRPRISR